MTLLFDIDYTLINTNKLKNQIQNHLLPRVLEIETTTLEKITQTYIQTLNSSIEFSPRKYIKFLSNNLNSDKQLRQKALSIFLDNKSNYKNCLYPETKPVLKDLKPNHSLGIFSEGEFEFQKAKLEQSGIENFFEPELIFIFANKENKVKEVWQKINKYPKPVYIIDDDLNHIKEIAKTNIKPILIDRQESYNGPINTIKNLEELHNLI